MTYGKPEEAFDQAEIKHDAEYRQPTEQHNPMENFASIVVYDEDGKLFLTRVCRAEGAKMPTLMDEYTSECLAVEAGVFIKSERVRRISQLTQNMTDDPLTEIRREY